MTEYELNRAKTVQGWAKGQPFGLKVVEISDGQFLASDAAFYFRRMAKAALLDGIKLIINSAWRSFRWQKRKHSAWKKSPEPKPAKPARPGWSNHHAGIAVDLNRAHDDPDGKGPIVGFTDAWLRANAHLFGFVNPYPWEPWHWEFRPEIL